MLLLLAKQHSLMKENFYHIMHTTIYHYLKAFSIIYKSSLSSNKRSGKIEINLLDERKYNVLSIEEIPYTSIEPGNCFLHNEIKLMITC